jgi:regulator of replication initiation timing
MLKTAAEFKDQFLLTGQLLNVEGSILTYMVRHIQSDQEATVVFNIENMTITCSCRKYESIGVYKISELKYNFVMQFDNNTFHICQVYYASTPLKSST